VAQVDKDTPAERAGLKVGDVVTRFNGTPVTNAQQFRFLVAKEGPGSDVKLDVWRNGATRNIDVKLGDRTKYVSNDQKQPAEEKQQDRWLGLSVATLTEDNSNQYGVEYTPGAIVVGVDPGSPADDAGLVAGDIIVKISGKDVKGADDFYKVAGSLKKSTKPVSFYIKRGNANIFVAVTPEQ
jgi:serine protease Do